jgi:protease stability complex PrcB-like protein
MRAYQPKIRIILLTTVAEIMLLATVAAAQEIAVTQLEFETITKAFYSGYVEKQFLVITDKEEWQAVWDIAFSRIDPKPPLPDLDFETRMVVAVFQGTRPSGGYSIAITKLTKSDGRLKVIVKETSPGANCGVPAVITTPFHMIETDKVKKKLRKKVDFVVEQEVRDCR